MSEQALRIAVPALGAPIAPETLHFADALIDFYGGEGIVLGVAQVPEERSLSESTLLVRRQRNLLRRVSEMSPNHNFRVDVRSAYSADQGVRDAVAEVNADLLLLSWSQTTRRSALRELAGLVAEPPCDLATVKPGSNIGVSSVLVTARGGPHARLALRLAEGLARHYKATLTLLHVVSPGWDEERQAREKDFFTAIRTQVRHPNVSVVEVESASVARALLSEGARHDLVVLGAAARDERSQYLFGDIPEQLARELPGTVAIVKTREPVTASTFGIQAAPRARPADVLLSERVDRWFAENTFHSHEFRNVRRLVDLKDRQGLTISVVLPTLNEEKTVGKIISTIQRHLMEKVPLVDELLVIDSVSHDRTVEIAQSLGVPVHEHPSILPQCGTYVGKGEALWKSLYVAGGDIIVWVDSDITDIHPKFVYGLLGPLLSDPGLCFVKGFYRRPLRLGAEVQATGGGRVTELTARPLINLFYPDLSGLVQPLAGEMAGRRSVLEAVPFFTGYGVETGLLIDILEQCDLRGIAQVDLENRIHRNQSLMSLSKMAFAIIQVVMKRLGDRNRIQLLEEFNTSMNLIHYSPAELFLEVKEIQEHERPPINTLPDYVAMHPMYRSLRRVAAGQVKDEVHA